VTRTAHGGATQNNLSTKTGRPYRRQRLDPLSAADEGSSSTKNTPASHHAPPLDPAPNSSFQNRSLLAKSTGSAQTITRQGPSHQFTNIWSIQCIQSGGPLHAVWATGNPAGLLQQQHQNKTLCLPVCVRACMHLVLMQCSAKVRPSSASGSTTARFAWHAGGFQVPLKPLDNNRGQQTHCAAPASQTHTCLHTWLLRALVRTYVHVHQEPPQRAKPAACNMRLTGTANTWGEGLGHCPE